MQCLAASSAATAAAFASARLLQRAGHTSAQALRLPSAPGRRATIALASPASWSNLCTASASSNEAAQQEEKPLRSKVQITRKRLDALVESEIIHFARALKPHPITLRQILAQHDAKVLREFLLEELPIRWARRLHLIQTLPNWDEFPHMRVIRSLYSDAFRKLRMIPSTDADLFRDTIQIVKRRHSNMLMHVVRSMRAMKEKGTMSNEQVDDFLDDFLTARIGTDILMSQYMAITRSECDGGPTSVIDPACDPEKVVRQAAADAKRLCLYHYGYAPQVDVIEVGKVRFPFISEYLNYMMFELLKNALRATTERYERKEIKSHPVRVAVCGDENSVVIRISDSGGGIPLDSVNKVWSYLYTTSKPQGEVSEAQYGEEDEDAVAPMAGFGCGLPLSRNYASYVGGRLELNSMPHYGTSAYLYLNRLGNAMEVVDVEQQSALPSRGFLPRVDG